MEVNIHDVQGLRARRMLQVHGSADWLLRQFIAKAAPQLRAVTSAF